mmetsp:Transcript_10492/g.30672  ORF Transcript_10492/g.30672 Transcript_10492/m.30672 type:complete len:238 (+) Transcript_10492:1392-2105(+)
MQVNSEQVCSTGFRSTSTFSSSSSSSSPGISPMVGSSSAPSVSMSTLKLVWESQVPMIHMPVFISSSEPATASSESVLATTAGPESPLENKKLAWFNSASLDSVTRGFVSSLNPGEMRRRMQTPNAMSLCHGVRARMFSWRRSNFSMCLLLSDLPSEALASSSSMASELAVPNMRGPGAPLASKRGRSRGKPYQGTCGWVYLPKRSFLTSSSSGTRTKRSTPRAALAHRLPIFRNMS